MATRSIRTPNNGILIAAAITLLYLATFRAWRATVSNPYSIPVVPWVAMHCARDAILGIALLIVALRKSQFAGAIAVIVATLLMFTVALPVVTDMAFGLAFHPSWWAALYLAIAAAIAGPLLFPWSSNANRPVFLWMGLTFGTMTLLLGSVAILARF
jgi:hypothetical protein